MHHLKKCGCIFTITLSPKIWRPRPPNRYIPIDYADDVDDGIFDYSHYGNTVFCSKPQLSDCLRKDIILFDASTDMSELDEGLVVSSSTDTFTAERIKDIVMKYCD